MELVNTFPHCLSDWLLVCPFVFRSVVGKVKEGKVTNPYCFFLSACRSVCLSLYLYIYWSFDLSVYLSVCLSIGLYVCLLVCLSACLSVCVKYVCMPVLCTFVLAIAKISLSNFW